MKYLHDNMIVHRDLKSDNILLDENYYPRICDFGLSTFSDYSLKDIKMSDYAGSPAYMAPEIFERSEYDFKIDVYSFSILAFELITEKFPYHLNKFQLKKKVLEGVRPDLSLIENEFIELFLTRCWSKNPKERPTFDEILIAMKKDEFKTYFNVDENEIQEYLTFIEENLDKTDLYKNFSIERAIYYRDRNSIKNYAFSLFTGMGKETNKLEGLKYMKIAADMGDSEAMYFYGQWIGNGKAVKPNYDESNKYFKMAADHGNFNGMYNYAQRLKEGKVVKKNLKEAAIYYAKASEYEDHEAMGTLGLMYQFGEGIPVDMNKAEFFLKHSADLGNSISMFNYANLQFMKRNYVEAAKYYKMGSECDDTDAMLNYCGMRQFGIQIDLKELIKYYKISAENGNNLAISNYIRLLLENRDYCLEYSEEAGLYVIIGSKKGLLSESISKMFAYIEMYCFFEDDILSDKNIRNLDNKIFNLSILANDGDINAQMVIGYLFYKGKHLKKNFDKAIYYYSLAANKNDSIAQNNLGTIYSDKSYSRRNIKKAIKYLKLSSDQNNSSAQNNLGVIYSEDQNMKKAIHYFNLSAEQNNSMAQYNLGIIYLKNDDVNNAFHYFKLAADNNLSDAQFALGIIYYEGKYVQKDIQKSLYYLSISSKQNNLKSKYVLGLIYYEEKLKSIKDIIDHFVALSDQNYALAQNMLGLIYVNDEPNIDKAIQYFTLASNQNLKEAQFNLGLIYIDEKYGKYDIKKSIKYFKLAADQNDHEAQNNLGVIYFNDKYEQRKIKLSETYLLKSAKKKLSKSQTNLGIFYYLRSNNNSKDINKAINYLSLAADQNDPIAKNILGVIYYEGQFVKQSTEKAISYFIEAAKENLNEALSNLEFILDNDTSCNEIVENREDRIGIKNISKDFYEGLGLLI